MALRFHYIPVRTVSQTTNADNDTEEEKLLHTIVGHIHQCIHYGNQHSSPIEKQKPIIIM